VLGVQEGEILFVDPAKSVLSERIRRPEPLLRVSDVSLGEAERIWDTTLSGGVAESVVCAMRNHADFTFVVPARRLVGCLKPILDYDGDTIEVSCGDLSFGIVVDKCVEDAKVIYELDKWGDW
jgi:hypothetical protein